MNTRRGVSVLISAFLMIAVGIAAAFFLAYSFSAPALPESDIPNILENVKIVKVTNDTNGGILIYLINTGPTPVKVSSLYVETPYSMLKQAFEASPPVILGSGEVTYVYLRNYSLDPKIPVNMKIVTEEGKESSVMYMEPQLSQFVRTYLYGFGLVSVPVELNGQITNETIVRSLLDDDEYFLVLYSNTSVTGSQPSPPSVTTSLSLNNATELVNLEKKGSKYQWEQGYSFCSMTFWLKAPKDANQINLNITLKLTQASSNKLFEVMFWDWDKSAYATEGSGYLKFNTSGTGYKSYLFSIKNVSNYVNSNNMSVKFMVKISRDLPYNAINIFEDPSDFKIDVGFVVIRNSFDANYTFVIPGEVSISNISSFSFKMVYSFNFSPVNFSFRIWDKDASRWVTLGDFTYNYTSGTMDTIYVSVPDNPSRYISQGIEYNIIRVNLYSPPAEVPFYEISLDVFRMNVLLSG